MNVLTRTVSAWTEDPVVPPSLVHGDLAGHNMHWAPAGSPAARQALQEGWPGKKPPDGPHDGGGASPASSAGRTRLGWPPRGDDEWVLLGILDWDLAARWDPALNPEYLSLWHGEEKLDAIARDRFEALRGRVWLAAMALESIYDASLREGTLRPADWRTLLRKTLPRFDRAVATLAELGIRR